MSSQVNSIFLGGASRGFRRRLLDDLAGVDARAAHDRGRGVNPLHPGGSGFRPPDGHGDRALWVTHGQRQPAHLAIGDPPPEIRWDVESLSRDWDFWREVFVFFWFFWLQKWYRRALLRGGATVLWWIPNKYSLLWGTSPWILQMLVSCWRSPLFLWSFCFF